MADADYAAAYEVAAKCYTDLVAGAAVDIVAAKDSRHRLQELLEDYANKLWLVREVRDALAEKKARKALADLKELPKLPPQPKPQSGLRAATIMCLPD